MCVFVYVCVFICIWKQKPGMKMTEFRLVVTTAKTGGSQDHNHGWEGTLPSETPMESHFSRTFLSLGWVVERGQSHISSRQAWNEEFQAASGLSIQLYWNFSWMAHVPRSPQGNLYVAQGYADTLAFHSLISPASCSRPDKLALQLQWGRNHSICLFLMSRYISQERWFLVETASVVKPVAT